AVSVAKVGTTAVIRQAGRYPDGRLDIVTIGGRRFRIDGLDSEAEPYLVADVRMLDEPIGERAEARRLARQVGRRFLRYLDLLAPTIGAEGDAALEID